ncbi:CHAT domain-containing tetratricopeptide repeat protein [Prochlorococcus marinus]|uniref:CHAT domain-containing tetratricopeptide repeat protein n=1 Tax=Prochlorococcus marinus TaxID=1219 RepID=UPI0022B4A162|nr:CHAT domain-containing protein [Prochlorococcus marinus]
MPHFNKTFSGMRRLVLIAALLVPVAMDGAFVAEVIPEVFISSESPKESADYYLHQGLEQLNSGDYPGALENFNKTIELDPSVWQAYHNRAIIKFDQKNFLGALADYTKSIELNADSFYWSFFNRGKTRQKLGDSKGAIDDYSKAIEINPKNYAPYNNRGYIKSLLNDHQGAIDDHSKAIEINPNQSYSYYARGTNKAELKDDKDAIDDYSKAIELKPEEANYYSARGYSKLSLGYHHGSIEDYSKAIKLKPKEAYYYSVRGYNKQQLGDHQGAIEDYSEAIELKPEETSYYSSRASNKASLGDHQGAISDYSKAIDLDPNEDQLYQFRGHEKGILGNFKGAIEDYSKAIKLNPNDPNSYWNRGHTKNIIEDFEGAIDDFSKAIELNPNNPFLYNNRGHSKISLEDFVGCIEDQSNAILIDPTFTNSFQNRAYCKQALGDFDGAIIDYKKVLEIGNSDEIVHTTGAILYLYFYNDNYVEIPNLINQLKLQANYNEKKHTYAAAIILYSQARLNLFYGNDLKAVEGLQESIRILSAIKKDNDYYYANAINLLINTYIDLKEFKKAKELIKPMTLNGQISLASIAFKQNDFLKAEKILKRLYNRQKNQSGAQNTDPYLIGGLGSAYWWQGKNEKALPLLRESVKRYEKLYGKSASILIQPIINLAMAHFNNKDYEQADHYLRRSLRMQFIQIQEQAPYIPLSKRNSFVDTLGISYAAIFSASNIHPNGKDLAFFARINRHGLLEEIERRQSRFASLDGPHLPLAERIKRVTNILASKRVKDAQMIKELNNEKERIELKLYNLLPEMKARIIETSEVAKVMPSNSVLIEYQKFRPFKFDNHDDAIEVKNWGEARYQAFLLKPNGEIESVDLGLATPIEQKIQQALVGSEQGLADAQELWNEVGALVVKPLTKAMGDAETLFLSPDAELNRIPFAALSSHKNDQLLGEAIDIRLLTTGRELLDLAKASKPTKQKPLVVANPAFNLSKDFPRKQESELIASGPSQQRSGDLGSLIWSPLPGTAKEGKTIAKLTKAQLLTKNKATALAVQEQQQAPKILHIASHAYFRADQEKGENEIASVLLGASEVRRIPENENPLLRSGVVLAGANEPEANPKDDGYLTALEVTKLDWQGTELVVISGCESGQGDIQSGEGVYGLKRAIAVAGARSSLLSLWKVDDRATASFMKKFYQKLKAGEGRADALAATQKEFRNHSIPGYRHPYVWAAFQLSGDWRPIKW